MRLSTSLIEQMLLTALSLILLGWLLQDIPAWLFRIMHTITAALTAAHG